jgi:hypothetical protein
MTRYGVPVCGSVMPSMTPLPRASDSWPLYLPLSDGTAALRTTGRSIEPSDPPKPYDRDADRHLGGEQRDELSRVVQSGDLHVGVLSRSTHGDERWS